MTKRQLVEADLMLDMLRTVHGTSAGVEWHVTYNYYTKLVEFTATTEAGHFKYGMTRHYDGKVVIYLNHNAIGKDENGFLVASGFGTDLIKRTLPRVNFMTYLDFIRENVRVPAEFVALV